jgi:hypothetical protein
MEKWWRVKKGVQLTALQQQKGVNLIMAWIKMQMKGGIDAVQRKMT